MRKKVLLSLLAATPAALTTYANVDLSTELTPKEGSTSDWLVTGEIAVGSAATFTDNIYSYPVSADAVTRTINSLPIGKYTIAFSSLTNAEVYVDGTKLTLTEKGEDSSKTYEGTFSLASQKDVTIKIAKKDTLQPFSFGGGTLTLEFDFAAAKAVFDASYQNLTEVTAANRPDSDIKAEEQAYNTLRTELATRIGKVVDNALDVYIAEQLWLYKATGATDKITTDLADAKAKLEKKVDDKTLQERVTADNTAYANELSNDKIYEDLLASLKTAKESLTTLETTIDGTGTAALVKSEVATKRADVDSKVAAEEAAITSAFEAFKKTANYSGKADSFTYNKVGEPAAETAKSVAYVAELQTAYDQAVADNTAYETYVTNQGILYSAYKTVLQDINAAYNIDDYIDLKQAAEQEVADTYSAVIKTLDVKENVIAGTAAKDVDSTEGSSYAEGGRIKGLLDAAKTAIEKVATDAKTNADKLNAAYDELIGKIADLQTALDEQTKAISDQGNDLEADGQNGTIDAAASLNTTAAGIQKQIDDLKAAVVKARGTAPDHAYSTETFGKTEKTIQDATTALGKAITGATDAKVIFEANKTTIAGLTTKLNDVKEYVKNYGKPVNDEIDDDSASSEDGGTDGGDDSDAEPAIDYSARVNLDTNFSSSYTSIENLISALYAQNEADYLASNITKITAADENSDEALKDRTDAYANIYNSIVSLKSTATVIVDDVKVIIEAEAAWKTPLEDFNKLIPTKSYVNGSADSWKRDYAFDSQDGLKALATYRDTEATGEAAAALGDLTTVGEAAYVAATFGAKLDTLTKLLNEAQAATLKGDNLYNSVVDAKKLVDDNSTNGSDGAKFLDELAKERANWQLAVTAYNWKNMEDALAAGFYTPYIVGYEATDTADAVDAILKNYTQKAGYEALTKGWTDTVLGGTYAAGDEKTAPTGFTALGSNIGSLTATSDKLEETLGAYDKVIENFRQYVASYIAQAKKIITNSDLKDKLDAANEDSTTGEGDAAVTVKGLKTQYSEAKTAAEAAVTAVTGGTGVAATNYNTTIAGYETDYQAYLSDITSKYNAVELTQTEADTLTKTINDIINSLKQITETSIQVNQDAYDALFADGNNTTAYIREKLELLNSYKLSTDQIAEVQKQYNAESSIANEFTADYAAGVLDSEKQAAYEARLEKVRDAVDYAVATYTGIYDDHSNAGSVYAKNQAYLDALKDGDVTGWDNILAALTSQCNAAVKLYDEIGALSNEGYKAYVASQVYSGESGSEVYGFPNHDELYAYHTKISQLRADMQALLDESSPDDPAKAFLFKDEGTDSKLAALEKLAKDTYESEMSTKLSNFLTKAETWAEAYYTQLTTAVGNLKSTITTDLTAAGVSSANQTKALQTLDYSSKTDALDNSFIDDNVTTDKKAENGQLSINLNKTYAPALDKMLDSEVAIKDAAVVLQWHSNHDATKNFKADATTLPSTATYQDELAWYGKAIEKNCQSDPLKSVDKDGNELSTKVIADALTTATNAIDELNTKALALANWTAPAEATQTEVAEAAATQLSLFSGYVTDAKTALSTLKTAYEASKVRSANNTAAQTAYQDNLTDLAALDVAGIQAYIADLAVSDAVRAEVDAIVKAQADAAEKNEDDAASLYDSNVQKGVTDAIDAVKKSIRVAYINAYHAEAAAIVDQVAEAEVLYNRAAAASKLPDDETYRTSIDAIRAAATAAQNTTLNSETKDNKNVYTDVETAKAGKEDSTTTSGTSTVTTSGLKSLETSINDIYLALNKLLGGDDAVAAALQTVKDAAADLNKLIEDERAAIANSKLTDGTYAPLDTEGSTIDYNEKATYNAALDKIAEAVQAQVDAATAAGDAVLTQADRYTYEIAKLDNSFDAEAAIIAAQIANAVDNDARWQKIVVEYDTYTARLGEYYGRLANTEFAVNEINSRLAQALGGEIDIAFEAAIDDYASYKLTASSVLSDYNKTGYTNGSYDSYAAAVKAIFAAINDKELAGQKDAAAEALSAAQKAVAADNIVDKADVTAAYNAAKAINDNSDGERVKESASTAENTVYFSGSLDTNIGNFNSTNDSDALADELIAWAKEVRDAADAVKTTATENTYTIGDANDDNFVNIADYETIVDWVLNDSDVTAPNDNRKGHIAVDLNADQTIDVSDLTGVLNITLGNTGTSNASRRLAALAPRQSDNNIISAEVVEGENGTTRVAVYLANSASFVAGQFDIKLPSGMSITDQSLTERANGLNLFTADLANGYTRVLVTAPAIHTIASGDGAIVYFDVTGNGSSIVIDNAIFADANAQRYEVSSANTSGIGSVIYDGIKNGAQRIYDASGRLLNRVQRGINIIRNADGTTTKQINKN